MKATFHYVVKLKLIRLKKTNEIEFIELEEKFENNNPIYAREQAFFIYQNYINSFLSRKGETYRTDKIAREKLSIFFNEGTNTKINFAGNDIDFENTIGNGIAIFVVIDKPEEKYVIEDKEGDSFLIHGIGNLGWANDPQSIITGLTHELWYYEQCQYNYKNYKETINFYEYDITQAALIEILKTPFDWTDYNKPFINDNNIYSNNDNLNSLINYISNGENHQIEFKPTLLFNHKTKKGGISIKGIIAKTICAFLNANGGFLFIGINSKGEIQGLEFDYSLSNGINKYVYFQLEFEQMLEHFLSLSVKSNVSGQLYKIDGKDVFVVTVLPSKHRPIFINGQENKEFFVRIDLTARHIIDIEEIVTYCINKW